MLLQKQSKVFAALLLSLIVFSMWDLMVGQVHVSWLQLLHWKTLNHSQSLALFELRLPRLLVAGFSGALFAASGTILQTVMRNPLAAPDIVGVTAGASIIAVAALLFFPNLSNMGIAWLACFGALAGFSLTFLFARVNGDVAPTRLALTGVAIGTTLLAGEHFLLLILPVDIGSSLNFIAGSVYGANWQRALAITPWALIFLGVTLFLGRALDLLALQDDTSIGIGFNVKHMRMLLLLLAVILAGLGVTGAGILGFVGLIAPQIARLIVGAKHQVILPAAMVVGALLVILADTLGRVIVPPAELPAGIITTIIGAPYFIYLLIRFSK